VIEYLICYAVKFLHLQTLYKPPIATGAIVSTIAYSKKCSCVWLYSIDCRSICGVAQSPINRAGNDINSSILQTQFLYISGVRPVARITSAITGLVARLLITSYANLQKRSTLLTTVFWRILIHAESCHSESQRMSSFNPCKILSLVDTPGHSDPRPFKIQQIYTNITRHNNGNVLRCLGR